LFRPAETLKEVISVEEGIPVNPLTRVIIVANWGDRVNGKRGVCYATKKRDREVCSLGREGLLASVWLADAHS
jgi:hypothetical protein